MGRGDKRTKKGKTFRGSYGNSRPKSVSPKVNTSKKNEEGSGSAESAA